MSDRISSLDPRIKNLSGQSFGLWKVLEYSSRMNWNNYGGKTNDPNKTWHIDHIKPHSSFNYQSVHEQEFLECWELKNLRPLEKISNLKKGNKYV